MSQGAPVILSSKPGPTPGTTSFQLPDGDTFLDIRIRAMPTGRLANSHWEVVGDVRYERAGVWRFTPATSVQFATPQSLTVDSPDATGTVSLITVFLSRLRDVQERVLQELRTVPSKPFKRRPPSVWPPPNNPGSQPWPPAPEFWDTPELEHHSYIETTPAAGGRIQAEKRTVDPQTLDVVFQIKGFAAPELIAVSYPMAGMPAGKPPRSDSPRTPESDPMPFLIYIKPGSAQNFDAGFFQSGPYPFGWDFLFFGLWRVVNYMGDPLKNPFPKGIPYQAAVAKKRPVLVVPSTHGFLPDKEAPMRELRDFMSAENVHIILEEIHAFFSWWLGFEFYSPVLGRGGMAAFSQGATQLSFFLEANKNHPFCLDVLKEVYFFDPHMDDARVNAGHGATAHIWANMGSSSDKCVRFYTQAESSAHGLFVRGVPGPTGIVAPYVETNGRFTAAVLPREAWSSTVGAPADSQDAHQLIPAFMLTDALRRSSFP